MLQPRFRIRFQNLKPFKREKITRLIAQTGYFNRNVILIFRFKHLFRIALKWVKYTVPRLSSWVSTFGWPESKITFSLAEKSISYGGLLLPSRINKIVLTFNNSVAQVQLNLHEYISSHHRRTRREYCRKLVPCRWTVTLQKAHRIPESQSGITRCVELHQMWQRHRCCCWRDLACPLNSPPSCTPECLHTDSTSACKISRYITQAFISAGTKPNNM